LKKRKTQLFLQHKNSQYFFESLRSAINISRRSVLDLSAMSVDPGTQHRYSISVHTEPHKVHTYVPRVPQCLSLRWNWDPLSTHSPASECASPRNRVERGTHSPECEGVGESQLERLRESLVLCLFCSVSEPLHCNNGLTVSHPAV
jgi:hypothetical protein